MSEIINDATTTEAEAPQQDLTDGQVTDAGDAVATDAEVSDEDLFNYDEYASKNVRIKVDGQEVVVPLSEALAGYQRQADYTRKTQELSEQRKQLELGAALQEALNNDPFGTLQMLQKHYGMGNDVQAEEEDIYLDPVQKEIQELKSWKEQIEYERTLSEIQKEVQALSDKYGEDFDSDEVITKALAMGTSDLEGTFKLIQFDKIYAQKKVAEKEAAESKQRTEAKRSAQVVSGGTSSKPATTAPVESPKSVLDAWKLAEKSLGI